MKGLYLSAGGIIFCYEKKKMVNRRNKKVEIKQWVQNCKLNKF